MRVVHFRMQNVLGLKLLEVEPGKITVFEGENGTGKTSVVEGLQTFFSKKSLKSLKNIDAGDEEAEIVLTFDGEDGRVIATRGENAITVKRQVGDTAAFEKVSCPAQYLLDIAPRGAVLNPVKFLSTDDKERIDMILNALLVEFNKNDFWASIGLNPVDYDPVPATAHPLVKVGLYRKSIFDRRTSINRDATQKRGACEQTRRKVPMEIPTVEGVEEKREELMQLKARHAQSVANISNTARSDEAQIKAEIIHAEQLARSEISAFQQMVYREAEERIAAKQRELDETLQEKRKAAEQRIGVIHAARDASMENINKLLPKIESLAEEIGTMNERVKDAERIRQTHEIADGFESEAIALEEDAKALTAALSRLEAYKAQMVENLPIPGLDITDGKVTVDGVPWSQVNTARRISIAVQVICLRFGDAKFKPVFMDGAEALDSKSMEILEAELERYGAQGFIARVADENRIRKVG
jgi:hypothetical protein